MKRKQYSSCGLDNVFLLNGYTRVDTGYGSATSIHDIDGLHQAISEALCRLNRPLTGAEFRFLRKELDLSQKVLGKILGKSDQAVAKWEKDDIQVPLACDLLLRNLYLESTGDNPLVSEMIKRMNEVDRRIQEQELTFKESEDRRWIAA